MKIVLTLDEVREAVRKQYNIVIVNYTEDFSKKTPVRFIHEYADGSGDVDVESITSIDRVEIDL